MKRVSYAIVFLAALALGAPTAQAEGPEICYKKIEVECPKTADCTCVGERGPRGYKGSKGRDGKDGKDGADGKDGNDGADGRDGRDGYSKIIVRERYSGLRISLGYLASVQIPQQEYAWAHGPSLRLISDLSRDEDLILELGWAPFRKEALMARASITHWIEDSPHIGLGGGLFIQTIGLEEGSGRGDSISLLGTLALRQHYKGFDFRMEIGPSLGGAFYDSGGDDGFILGAVGSAGLSWRFD